MQPLYVVTAAFNPLRYQSRARLYRDFAARCQEKGVNLLTVELAFGERPHALTEAGHPWHLQLRTAHELWFKENLLNLAIQRLPADWQYVAWVDADVEFVRPDWAAETVHQLQHFPVVQMFSQAHDLGPDLDAFQAHRGFAWSYHQWQRGVGPANMLTEDGSYYGGFWHPGFAWACRRDFFNAVGGLLDFGLGAADHHMALGLIGQAERSLPGGLASGYTEGVYEWQRRAERLVKRNLGYVPGLLLHHWHGKKRQRGYQDRWAILRRHQFDPHRDLVRDFQGLYQLTDTKPALRDAIRHYFRARHEDSIDLDDAERTL